MITTPWRQLCTLRDDVRRGTLTLDEFAADLNGVRTGDARLVYREPAMFFDRTYPTFRMKALAGDVLRRLAGGGGKPVLQLQVAYGGGKTHTLITLLHLAERGQALADHKTVGEFLAFAGLTQAPRARVALLPGDQFDVKEGLEVYGPEGKTRRVRTLWGALSYQLAGDVGYARLKSHDESSTVPAEPLLVDLLRAPLKEELGALVLVDEAVWYYRGLVNENPRMLGTIKDFYQVLTQAVAKVERAALVASLIASRTEANDQTGIQCLEALNDVFGRLAEPVDPVARDDVAEVLRRRLFEQVPGEAERRPVIDAVMAAMHRVPLREAQRDQAAYDRLMASYPFHPDLINVLYQKWTQISGFQRTRGALRLLASALRDSEGRDPSPLVGPGSLLSPLLTGEGPGVRSGLSPALIELIKICEERERWTPILTGELDKAREIQAALPTIQAREVEQAVVAAFLHSQPMGQRAAHTDLLALLAHPLVDPAALEEGLRKWRNLSWFLVEDPDAWQLGTTPNLTHMHVQAMGWLNEDEIEEELKRRIQVVPQLAAADPGVEVHRLPVNSSYISDDLKLHYLILGPECAVEPGKPLPACVESYFDEKSGPGDPRIYRNNLVALVPEVSRVAGLREQVRRWLGWTRLEKPENYKLLTDSQKKELPKKKQEAANNLPEAVIGAYNILVAVDEAGHVQAQTLRSYVGIGGAPFERIKAMLVEDERLLATTLDPDLVLPGSYLQLWSEGQASRRVTDLMAAFGQFPRLPRLLRPEALYDTLARGVREGILVLRLPRADGSARTWWQAPPDDEALRRVELEVQPARSAVLHHIEPELLAPERLSGLWPSPTAAIGIAETRAFFGGTRAPRLETPDVLDKAIRAGVERGTIMALVGDTAFYGEALPTAGLPGDLLIAPPPTPIRGADLVSQALPRAWSEDQTTARTLREALAGVRGYPIPWSLLSEGINEALRLRLFEHVPAGEPWPCSPAVVDKVWFRPVEQVQISTDMIEAALDYANTATPTLRALKEAIETRFVGRQVPEDVLIATVQAAIRQGRLVEADERQRIGAASNVLTVKVRRPAAALLAETVLDAAALQKLAERIEHLLRVAPELAFTFKLTVSAEGQRPDSETLRRLNVLLDEVQKGWALN
jgi:hypothetical protein